MHSDDRSGADAETLAAASSSYLRLGADSHSAGSVEVVLSAEAYRLHYYCLMDSTTVGHPGEIPTGAIGAGNEGAVRELVAAGMWQPIEEGFRVVDAESLELMAALYAHAGSVAENCSFGAGHVLDDANPGFCARCHSPLAELA
jgi:hypothetical protein